MRPHYGEWRSLVAQYVRDVWVGGSNPLSPTKFQPYRVAINRTLPLSTADLRRSAVFFIPASAPRTIGRNVKGGHLRQNDLEGFHRRDNDYSCLT